MHRILRRRFHHAAGAWNPSLGSQRNSCGNVATKYLVVADNSLNLWSWRYSLRASQELGKLPTNDSSHQHRKNCIEEERRCEPAWLREVKTHNVQSWLEDIAREHRISKTTLKHVKNFLSGVFRHAAQQGSLLGRRWTAPPQPRVGFTVSFEGEIQEIQPTQDVGCAGHVHDRSVNSFA